MQEPSDITPLALIALIAKLVTAFVGYCQWKRQQDTARQVSQNVNHSRKHHGGYSIWKRKAFLPKFWQL
jgi:DNA-binding transcriptional regulator of glucitol operon